MHVVHLTDSSSSLAGGISVSLQGLAKAQLVAGLRISVLAGHDHLSRSGDVDWAPLVPVTVNSAGFVNGICGKALMARLDALQPDFVHLHGIWGPAARALSRWALRNGTPYAVSPHGMLDQWALQRSATKKRVSAMVWENKLLSGAAFIHALAEAELAAVRDFGLVNPVAMIPNGVDMVDARAPVGPNSGPRVLLFMARIHPKKGLSEMLSAWALLAPDLRRQWHLQVAGWDEIGILDGLRAQAQRLGIADSVSFPGGLHGPAKVAALSAAHAFILPSHSEGLPMGVLEAWANGLPVFMTPACNLPEGFEVGAAFCISTRPEDMARVLAERLPDHTALSLAGAAGRNLARTRFGWPAIAASMLAQYRGALEGR